MHDKKTAAMHALSHVGLIEHSNTNASSQCVSTCTHVKTAIASPAGTGLPFEKS
jgi:hypothetical protein